uniref:mannose-binding protein-like n=1 Tax=Pristiophorus japonicus TaxID=55135 RepID=UPI00398F787E
MSGPVGPKGEKGDTGNEGPAGDRSQISQLEEKLQLLQHAYSQLRNAFSVNTGIQDVTGKLLVASSKKANFENAKRICRKAGGELVSPRNSVENEALATLTAEKKIRVFLGITAARSEGTFKYLNRDTVVYNNWFPGEPDNSDNNEDCVVFHENGTWTDYRCDQEFSVVCEFV